jgi:hypothetical protein
MGLERGPLSFVSKTEELLGRKSSGSGLETREYGRRDPSRWPRGILYPQKLTLTSPTSGGRSVGVVRSRTQATEFVLDQWLSLDLWKEPTGVGFPLPSPQDRNIPTLRNAAFPSYLEFLMFNKFHKPSDSDCYASSPEPFRFYQH